MSPASQPIFSQRGGGLVPRRDNAANGGKTKGLSVLPSSFSSANSPRLGSSAIFAFDGTQRNHDEISSASENAAKACRIRTESGDPEYPLISAAMALVLSIQWTTRRPRSSGIE